MSPKKTPDAQRPTPNFLPFTPKDPVILALSGGADSIFLGEMLHWNGFRKVVVAHFEHGFRGEESKRDQTFCGEKAREWDWKFETKNWNSPQKSEEKAREARYAFLEEVRKKENAKAIFLAHHRDDQVETIFFQFLRGSGVRGLSGMKRLEEKRRLFRPLLDISKQEILEFLRKEKIEFREDSTNADAEAFDRNFLRLNVLPLLQSRFPQFQTTLVRNAELFSKLETFLAGEAEKVVRKIGKKKNENDLPSEFSRKDFFAVPEFLRGEILRMIFSRSGTLRMPTYEQIMETEEFLKTAKSGKEKSLLGVKFQVYGENVFVEML